MGRLSIEVLTAGEQDRLHQATLDVFEKTGIKVMHKGAREKLSQAGAITDETDIVRFPRQMVEDLLLLAPREVQLAKLNGDILHIGGRNRYYTSPVMDPWVIDFETGPRPPVLEDVRRLAIIGDALERVSAMSLMEYPPSDIDGPEGYLKCLETFAVHTTKHTLILPTSVEAMNQRLELAEIMADGATLRDKPIVSLAATMTTPLIMTEANVEIEMVAIERGIPLFLVECSMAGTTSPYSFAGTIVISNVEALFPILLAQVLSPGHPVIYCFDPSTTDMHSGGVRYYPPDKFLFRLAATQMGHYYGLPTRGIFAGSMVARYDPQNGMENVLFALSDIVGGQHLVSSLGSFYNANGVSEEQVIIDDTMAAMVEHLAKGIVVDDLHLGLDTIHEVGPGNHYLGEDMTRKLMRSGEFFSGGVMNLTGEDNDEDSMMFKAHARAQEIVETHKTAVPEHTVEEIRRFIRKEEAKL